ncbi:MAG: molybdopterin-dependent oxidoreductase [Chloroflexi bacterium]|nr:molybdopterin-dependent oxidoreductase [Chloroflexota bacterium]
MTEVKTAKSNSVLSEVKTVKTICLLCTEKCGIEAHVEDGKIVKITGMPEHQSNVLCAKGYAIPELVHSKDRLTSPLKKVDGEFREISWDEAFSFVAEKLATIKQKFGPQALVTNLGTPFTSGSFINYVARRFCDLYGTPNFTTGASFCYLARTFAHNLTLGARALPHCSDSVHTKCAVLWGSNVVESHDPIPPRLLRAELKRGTKLIVIDPKATSLAKEADIHAQVRPGTDCALALGMLNVIISEGLYDKAFVEQWTIGFDKLAESVKAWPPEKVEAVTWVRAETVRDMARMYATSKPAHILQGISMDHSTNGIQASRAIAILTAITGNLDVPGGEVLSPKIKLANIRLEDKVVRDVPAVGADYPIYSKYLKEETVVPAITQMITGKPYPIKAMIIAGSNPAVTWPNQNKVRRGFANLELLVVIDLFMTETAKLADVVLPAASFFERAETKDYSGYGYNLAILANRIVPPIGNSMEDWQIWAGLGRKLGYAEYFPWKDTEELLEYMLKPTNLSLEQLRANPGGIYYAQREYKKYLKEGFATPSKKVEIFSELLKEHGYDPLPTYHEPAESPISRPDLVQKYPLILISGPRTVAYFHTQHRNLPSLRKIMPEPYLHIHPQVAKGLSISDDDLVTVESQRGSIKIKAKLNEDVHPKIVMMQHGWSEANCNFLTDDEARDPVSGYPGFRSVMCRVTKTK